MNASLPPETLARIKELLFGGRKIEAIKLYRESVAGTGLADARTAIEGLEKELRAASPEQFAAPRQSDRSFLLDPHAKSFQLTPWLPSDFSLRHVPIFITVFLVLAAVSVGLSFLLNLFPPAARLVILAFALGCYMGIAIGKRSSRRAEALKGSAGTTA